MRLVKLHSSTRSGMSGPPLSSGWEEVGGAGGGKGTPSSVDGVEEDEGELEEAEVEGSDMADG